VILSIPRQKHIHKAKFEIKQRKKSKTNINSMQNSKKKSEMKIKKLEKTMKTPYFIP